MNEFGAALLFALLLWVWNEAGRIMKGMNMAKKKKAKKSKGKKSKKKAAY